MTGFTRLNKVPAKKKVILLENACKLWIDCNHYSSDED